MKAVMIIVLAIAVAIAFNVSSCAGCSGGPRARLVTRDTGEHQLQVRSLGRWWNANDADRPAWIGWPIDGRYPPDCLEDAQIDLQALLSAPPADYP